MTENNIKPSIVKTFYEMTQNLMKVGFSERDVIILIQDRTKPKMSMKSVKTMLEAIIKFEEDYLKFQEIIGESNLEKLKAIEEI